MKLLISFLTLLASICAYANNVELTNDRVLKNIKLMSRTDSSVMVYHSEGLEQIPIKQFSNGFLDERKEFQKDAPESSQNDMRAILYLDIYE